MDLQTRSHNNTYMAIPSVQQLDRPAPLHLVMGKDKPEDCFPCRVTGERTSDAFKMCFSNQPFQGPPHSLVWAHTATFQAVPN